MNSPINLKDIVVELITPKKKTNFVLSFSPSVVKQEDKGNLKLAPLLSSNSQLGP
jgi:hypothetical protein